MAGRPRKVQTETGSTAVVTQATTGSSEQDPKAEWAAICEASPILKRLRIVQDYVQYIVLIDVSDIVPFTVYKLVETIFSKLGLVIRRQFGYLGYAWGYGAIKEVRDGESAPVMTAPTSLNIYFQEPIVEADLVGYAEKFETILRYLKREIGIYKGVIFEEF